MTLAILTFTLVWAAAAVSAASTLEARQTSCSAVHIFLAKGNNEPNPGRQGKLAGAICFGLESCDYEDIQFNNPYESNYCTVVQEGVANGIAQITAYASRCPDSRLVVSGYSQGSHIVGDVLGGTVGTFIENCTQVASTGLDPTTAPGSKIAAALLFGDTRHMPNQQYNVLSGAAGTGIAPRSEAELAGLNRFSNVLRSYCAGGDSICDTASNPVVIENHLNYFDLYSDDAATWVKETLKSASVTAASATASVMEDRDSGSATRSSIALTSSPTGHTSTESTSLAVASLNASPSLISASAGVISSTTTTSPVVSASAVVDSIASTLLPLSGMAMCALAGLMVFASR